MQSLMFRFARRLAPGAAAIALPLMLAAACGGGSDPKDDATLNDYYTRLAAAIQQFDERVAPYADHIQTSDDPQIAQAMGAYNSDLQSLAHDTDILKPPSVVRGAHGQLVKATVDMGSAMLSLSAGGIGQHPPTQKEFDYAIQQARAVKSWNDACHELQDKASAKKFDVDLRCATALHQRETPGI